MIYHILLVNDTLSPLSLKISAAANILQQYLKHKFIYIISVKDNVKACSSLLK